MSRPDSPDHASDGGAAGLVWVLQVCLAVVTPIFVALMSMSETADCGYERTCGSPMWTTVSIWTSIGGGAALALLFAGLIARSHSTRSNSKSAESSWPTAAGGVLAQFILLTVALAIGAAAGPL